MAGLLRAGPIQRKESQLQLELELVTDRDPFGTGERNLRLEPARRGDSASVQADEHEAPLLVETERGQIVVRRDEPEAAAAGRARGFGYGVEKRRAYAPAFDEAVDRDDFPRVALRGVCEEPDSLAALERNEPGSSAGV